jgi:hypothetical protein
VAVSRVTFTHNSHQRRVPSSTGLTTWSRLISDLTARGSRDYTPNDYHQPQLTSIRLRCHNKLGWTWSVSHLRRGESRVTFTHNSHQRRVPSSTGLTPWSRLISDLTARGPWDYTPNDYHQPQLTSIRLRCHVRLDLVRLPLASGRVPRDLHAQQPSETSSFVDWFDHLVAIDLGLDRPRPLGLHTT